MDYEQLKRELKNQKVEMTPDERIKAYTRGEEVDCLPYFLNAPEAAFADIFGYTTKQMNDIDVMIDIISRASKEFDYSGIYVGLGLRTLGIALGSEAFYPEHGMDYLTSFVLKDYLDFDKIKDKEVSKNKMLLGMLEDAKLLKKTFPDMAIATGVSGPITVAAAIRPLDLILRDTVKNPELLNSLLDLCVERSLEWVKMFCDEFGPVATSIADPVTCIDILSKKQFINISMPYLEKLIIGIKKITGMEPNMHICGKTRPVWENIKKMNLSGFSVDNCEDLSEAKRVFGESMMIIGNVPPVDVMKEGSIDDVINACRECIEKAGDSKCGYQLSTGCQIPIGTPRENVEAFIYAARKYGRQAKIGVMPRGITLE